MVEQQIIIIKKLIATMTLLVGLLQQQQTIQLPRLGQVMPSLSAAKPLTDYKFWYIKRNNAGQITEAAVRFYEGAITTKLEHVPGTTTPQLVTRYRRTKRLQRADIPYIPERFVKELSGNDAKIYTPQDFGVIYTDDQLRTFLNSKLLGDTQRDAIPEQRNPS